MQGILTTKDIKQQHDNTIPYEFDCTQLPQLGRNQVVFFDECHMDQEGGPVTGAKYQVRFPHAEGRYFPPSPTNPNSHYAPSMPKPRYKYTQQARFCLGVVAVRTKDGRIVGRRSVVFDYTGQRLSSLSEYKRRMKEEMNRVRNLSISGIRSKWISNKPEKINFTTTIQSHHTFHESTETQNIQRTDLTRD